MLSDSLLRDGLRHVKDKAQDSLVEAERHFLTMALDLLQVCCLYLCLHAALVKCAWPGACS